MQVALGKNLMIVTLNEDVGTRLKTWSKATKQPPEVFITKSLERSLEDWEDYTDAVRICAEVDAGRMKVYSMDEVERHLDKSWL